MESISWTDGTLQARLKAQVLIVDVENVMAALHTATEDCPRSLLRRLEAVCRLGWPLRQHFNLASCLGPETLEEPLRQLAGLTALRRLHFIHFRSLTMDLRVFLLRLESVSHLWPL